MKSTLLFLLLSLNLYTFNSLSTLSQLRALSMNRELQNNQTVPGNITIPITGNITAPIAVPIATPPIPTSGNLTALVPSTGNLTVPAGNQTTPPIPLDSLPIPLPPTVHPGFPIRGRNTTIPGNQTITPPENLTTPIVIAVIPIIPASQTKPSNNTQLIPLNFWVAAGNKTYIVLRNENDHYVKCERGIVSGENRKGNVSEILISYLWEPEIVNDNSLNLKTYDGNYLDYSNYAFNCNSTNSPVEHFKVIKGSYLTGGPTVNRTDYLSFMRGIFYLGIENGQAKLLEETNSNAKFVPIFNRIITNNTALPSS